MPSPRLLALPAVAAVAIAGCGGSSKKATTTRTAAPAKTTTTQAAPAATPAAAGKPLVAVSNATDTAQKPRLARPHGTPPASLVSTDLVVGKGPVAKAGALVTVQYVGVSWSTGKQFDASWDRGQPFSFPLGQGQVIQGWDQGVAGMRVGGRRELVIPPALGYGAQGAGPDIKPNETLVFVVDLKRVG